MEETILKQKYNDLLESFAKGQEFLDKNPDNEAAQNKLQQIANEMENILTSIADFTQEEAQNGFKIEQVDTQVGEQVTTKRNVAVTAVKESSNQLQNFSNNWDIAQKLSKSSLLPKEYQGHPENTLLAMGMAQKMGLDLITTANNLQLIQGRLEWKGSFITALIETSGKFKDLDFVYVGEKDKDTYGCYLEATRVRDNKRIKGTTITIAMAKGDGWYSRNKKWQTMAEQMLLYRAATFFGRAYCSEVLGGLNTEGELEDIQGSEKVQPQDIL